MENNNIQKPISLAIKEAKENIVAAINGAQMHPVLLEMIVKELYLEIEHQAKITTEREKAEYERMIYEQANKPVEKVEAEIVK